MSLYKEAFMSSILGKSRPTVVSEIASRLGGKNVRKELGRARFYRGAGIKTESNSLTGMVLDWARAKKNKPVRYIAEAAHKGFRNVVRNIDDADVAVGAALRGNGKGRLSGVRKYMFEDSHNEIPLGNLLQHTRGIPTTSRMRGALNRAKITYRMPGMSTPLRMAATAAVPIFAWNYADNLLHKAKNPEKDIPLRSGELNHLPPAQGIHY